MTKPTGASRTISACRCCADAEVEAVVKACHDRGYQMVCHAIGDGAIEQLITAYEKALAANPDPDRRIASSIAAFPHRSECTH